jgi:hypothetical protein
MRLRSRPLATGTLSAPEVRKSADTKAEATVTVEQDEKPFTETKATPHENLRWYLQVYGLVLFGCPLKNTRLCHGRRKSLKILKI